MKYTVQITCDDGTTLFAKPMVLNSCSMHRDPIPGPHLNGFKTFLPSSEVRVKFEFTCDANTAGATHAAVSKDSDAEMSVSAPMSQCAHDWRAVKDGKWCATCGEKRAD